MAQNFSSVVGEPATQPPRDLLGRAWPRAPGGAAGTPLEIVLQPFWEALQHDR